MGAVPSTPILNDPLFPTCKKSETGWLVMTGGRHSLVPGGVVGPPDGVVPETRDAPSRRELGPAESPASPSFRPGSGKLAADCTNKSEITATLPAKGSRSAASFCATFPGNCTESFIPQGLDGVKPRGFPGG